MDWAMFALLVYAGAAMAALWMTDQESRKKGQPTTLLGTLFCIAWPVAIFAVVFEVARSRD